MNNSIPIPGFKCPHCPEFSKEEEEINEHLKDCPFNPANKTCWICKHRTTPCRYSPESFACGVTGEYLSIEMEEDNCPHFEIEKDDDHV